MAISNNTYGRASQIQLGAVRAIALLGAMVTTGQGQAHIVSSVLRRLEEIRDCALAEMDAADNEAQHRASVELYEDHAKEPF